MLEQLVKGNLSHAADAASNGIPVPVGLGDMPDRSGIISTIGDHDDRSRKPRVGPVEPEYQEGRVDVRHLPRSSSPESPGPLTQTTTESVEPLPSANYDPRIVN